MKIQERFGVFGEPMLIGLVLGAFIGSLAGYDIKGIVQLKYGGCSVPNAPHKVRILMEGLLPLSESGREYLNKRFPEKKYLLVWMRLSLSAILRLWRFVC